MPVFTALAAGVTAIATAVGFGAAAAASIGAFVVRTLVTVAISSLIANRANKFSAGASDVGARVQLGPATNNKLAVSYGTAFLAPTVTDAKITTDQKTMYYVFSLCEASSGSMSFGKIFWNGKEVTLGTGDYGGNNKVVSLTTNATPPQVDDTINGYAWVYQFNNGSGSGINTGGTSAITILSDAGIPAVDRWTSTDVMTNTCFIVVKVIYNKDVQDSQQMPRLSVQLTNTLTKPGAVFLDYMTNTTYGCAIDVTNIDTASLIALDVYSDQTITYIPVGGGTTTQPRYRIDGPVNTGDNCLANLQQLADACDSWLQYSELTGKWTIVMNKPYSGVLGDLYSVDSSVLIGGIEINPLDLNQTYNSLEVQYPNANINDQTDYKVVDLTTVGTAWYDPSLLSPNEPDNRLTVQYPQINNYIRAVYLGVRRLLQSREDLTISCNLDYSGIQVVAGDVVRVTLAEYGWTDKLFRVSQVQETKTPDGFLGARITAFEYNASVYADNALLDFVPEANTGLSDPNIFDRPGTPTITTNTLANSGAVTSFTVTSTVPLSGTTIYMDFNYGSNSNVAAHKSYTSTQLADGTPYTNGDSVAIEINDLPIGNYYFSTTARNELAGRASFSSSLFNWGANLQANSVTYNNMSNTVVVSASVGGYSYEIPNTGANTVTLPVNINTLGNVNSTRGNSFGVPKYLDVTYSGGGGLFPYFQGNSTTSIGYQQNSTGVYTPALASSLVLQNGDLNWYALEYRPTTTSVSTSEQLVTIYSAQLIANVNCAIQLAPFVTVGNAAANLGVIATAFQLYTYTLYAGEPQYVYINIGTIGANSIDGGGIFIRSFSSANITVTGASFQLQKYKR
jgi:hypothetical protein